MSISEDDKKNIRLIANAIFGADFILQNPTEETVLLFEKMILEMYKCNRKIQILFKSLHCAIIGKGWLKRCLKAIANIILKEPRAFSGCTNVSKAFYRDPIYISAI